MVFKLANRVAETTTTTGTGAVTLAGAKAGFLDWASEYANDDAFYYLIKDTSNNWELGMGSWSSALDRVNRSYVVRSSNSNALVNFGAGTKDVSVVWLAEVGNQGDYGDGSDGDWTASSGTLTLTRDTFFRRVTLTGSAAINTAGFKLFVSEVLDIDSATSGYIGRVPPTATGGGTLTTGGSGSSGLAANTVGDGQGGGTGGNGSTGTGVQAGSLTAPSPAIGGRGGSGGKGGDSTSGAGGPQRTTSAPTIRQMNRRVPELFDTTVTAALLRGGGGGTGGSGGSGDGVNSGRGGGGGGGGGAVVYVAARIISRSSSTAAGIFFAGGGQGGSGRSQSGSVGNQGAGGGGGGGAGGCVYIMCDFLVGSTKTSAVDVRGGAGGAGGTGVAGGDGGNGGNGGNGGRFILISGDGCSEQVGGAGGSGGTTTTSVAGTAGAAGSGQFDL